MKTTHSPLPWFLQDTTKDPVAKNRRLTIATDPKYVSAVASVCRRIGMEDQDKSNAQFIVTACNSHHALVEALGECQDTLIKAMQHLGCDSCHIWETVERCRQALALARGEVTK